MSAPKAFLVPIFLAAQALFVHWTGTIEQLPPNPDLTKFPSDLGQWQKIGDEPVDLATKAQLGADQILNANYLQKPGQMINLFVAWFQSQRAGTSQPHSPQVCLPASGWTPESTGLIDLDTRDGKITVNRYVIAKGAQRVVVLYWYQTPRRVIAGEWAAKFWLMTDAFRDRRTDTSLVRITSWVGESGVEGATASARDYAAQAYPLLKDAFPHPRELSMGQRRP